MNNKLLYTLIIISLFGFISCSKAERVIVDEVDDVQETKYFYINELSSDESNFYAIFSEVDPSEYPTASSVCVEMTPESITDAYIKVVVEGTTIISGQSLLPVTGGYCYLDLSFLVDKVNFKTLDSETILDYVYDPTTGHFTIIVPREEEEEDACPTYGDAGGCIFYDKGEESFGWRYLEVAPSGTNGLLPWDNELPFEETFAVDQDIGMGEEMTAMILSTLGYSDVYAAGYCDALEVEKDGVVYDDWFLPSGLELELMYDVLYVGGYGNFNLCGHWSSNESGTDNAFHVAFGGAGTAEARSKGDTHCVRCIRAL